MSTMTVERLDETMLASSLPCEVIIAGVEQSCGKSAAFRVKSACPCKPSHPPDFICAECLAELKNGWLYCLICGAIVTSWRML